MPDLTPETAVHELARIWNAGDEEAYMAMFAPTVEFGASESWPETASATGLEALSDFWQEFRAVWDDVKLEVHEVRATQEAGAARCSWVTRGRASGVEGALGFAVTLWVEDGLVVKGQFFDEYEDAVAATGLA